jgi:hypothetical protein
MQLANTAAIALATGAGGALVAAFSAGQEASPVGLTIQGVLMLCVVGLGILVAGRLPARHVQAVATAQPSGNGAAIAQELPG